MAQPGVPALLARFRALTDSYPGAVLLGEVSSQEAPFARITRYTVPGQGLHIAYTLRPLRGASVTAAIADAFREIDALPTEPAVCWCFSNHDVERVASRWNPACEPDAAPDADFVRSMLALLLSLGGAVCLFQGEELGLPEAEIAPADLRDPFGIAYFPEFRGRDGSRTPMPWRSDEVHAGFTSGDRPWLPIPAEHRAVSVADQERDPGSLLNACRGLIAWRKAHPVLMQGGLRPLRLPEPLIGFERALGAVRFLCLFNPSQDTMHLPLDRYPDMEALTGHELGVSISGATAILRPFGVLVASAGRAAAPQVRSPLERRRRCTPRRVVQGRRRAVRTGTGTCPINPRPFMYARGR
jgi:alpha-glucosidase